MNIIIVGAGEVGTYLAKTLSEKNYSVTIIESNEEQALLIDEELNAKVITDNGTSAKVLLNAKVDEADWLLTMTSSDATNIVAASIGKSLGAKQTIARIHHRTYTDCFRFNYQLHFGIDYLMNPEALCAVELAKTIRSPGRVAIENIARGQIEVQQITVTPESKFTKVPLKDLKLGKQVRIAYISRDGEISIPNGDTELHTHDLVTVVGPSEALFELKPKFNPKESYTSRKVTLFGGTETAIVLAQLLRRSHFKIRIIEKKQKVCESLSHEFPDATIIQGDATSLKLLQEEQLGESDCFVACTKDDEDNIMTCIQAKRLGVKHVQLVINKPDYEPVLNEIQNVLGVETAVSPRNATVRELLRYISKDTIIEITSLPDSSKTILQATVSHKSRISNARIRDIPFPSQTLVIGLLHKFRGKVAEADDTVLPGDKLILITDRNNISKLEKLLK